MGAPIQRGLRFESKRSEAQWQNNRQQNPPRAQNRPSKTVLRAKIDRAPKGVRVMAVLIEDPAPKGVEIVAPATAERGKAGPAVKDARPAANVVSKCRRLIWKN